MPNELEENNNLEINKTDSLEESKETSSILFTSSKLHNFENFPEPRNATEEEQEVNDFAKSSSSKNNSMSKKISSIFKVNYTKNLRNYKSKMANFHNNNNETMKHHSYIDDEDEVHNNPNLHSEEQDELEIPES
uniref:Uncharacterized protein n=1 Tax=Rhizophagus irregularis (strain DAOM 181602 / DAOM 197198 / MUCL 43194) TaxID=747089 RepID=U9TTT9_RHIID